MMKNEKNNGQQSVSSTATLAVAALSALVGFGAVYGTLTPADNRTRDAAPAPVNASNAPPASAAASRSLAGFVRKSSPAPMEDVSFLDAAGQKVSLKDFKGKTILLNLWATWCAPCREEMPSLDRLQQEMGSTSFQVLALAVDRNGAEAAKKFLDGIGAKNLAVYVDPTARATTPLKLQGMPTTILIDAEGRELGRIAGPAEWDSAEAKTLITSMITEP